MAILEKLRGIYKPRFTNKDEPMRKCKLHINGLTLVADPEDAIRVFRMFQEVNLEQVDYDYISRAESPTGESQHLSYLKSFNNQVKIEGLDAEDYAMWKLYTSTRGEKK